MVVLSRKKNESIVINNDIVVTVVEVRDDKVRLGIVAPKECSVHRQEVFDAIHGMPLPPPSAIRRPPVPRTPEEAPFLQAIFEHPEDDDNRSIFADWLEERGDPLAEVLRNQCRMAQLPYKGVEWLDLQVRQRLLWNRHGNDWTGLVLILMR